MTPVKEPTPNKNKPKIFTNGVELEVPSDAGHRESKPREKMCALSPH